MATKFKVGDKIIGNSYASERYGITTKGWEGEVTKIVDDEYVMVKGPNIKDSIMVRIDCFNLVTPTYSVDQNFIREAHKAACSEWKKKIEKKFPKLFKDKLYEFGDSYNISTDGFGDKPLIIGKGMVPSELRGKCLIVDSNYKMEVIMDGSTQILTFKEIS